MIQERHREMNERAGLFQIIMGKTYGRFSSFAKHMVPGARSLDARTSISFCNTRMHVTKTLSSMHGNALLKLSDVLWVFERCGFPERLHTDRLYSFVRKSVECFAHVSFKAWLICFYSRLCSVFFTIPHPQFPLKISDTLIFLSDISVMSMLYESHPMPLFHEVIK